MHRLRIIIKWKGYRTIPFAPFFPKTVFEEEREIFVFAEKGVLFFPEIDGLRKGEARDRNGSEKMRVPGVLLPNARNANKELFVLAGGGGRRRLWGLIPLMLSSWSCCLEGAIWSLEEDGKVGFGGGSLGRKWWYRVEREVRQFGDKTWNVGPVSVFERSWC